jgi:hypothetical protein
MIFVSSQLEVVLMPLILLSLANPIMLSTGQEDIIMLKNHKPADFVMLMTLLFAFWNYLKHTREYYMLISMSIMAMESNKHSTIPTES